MASGAGSSSSTYDVSRDATRAALCRPISTLRRQLATRPERAGGCRPEHAGGCRFPASGRRVAGVIGKRGGRWPRRRPAAVSGAAHPSTRPPAHEARASHAHSRMRLQAPVLARSAAGGPTPAAPQHPWRPRCCNGALRARGSGGGGSAQRARRAQPGGIKRVAGHCTQIRVSPQHTEGPPGRGAALRRRRRPWAQSARAHAAQRRSGLGPGIRPPGAADGADCDAELETTTSLAVVSGCR